MSGLFLFWSGLIASNPLHPADRRGLRDLPRTRDGQFFPSARNFRQKLRKILFIETVNTRKRKITGEYRK